MLFEWWVLLLLLDYFFSPSPWMCCKREDALGLPTWLAWARPSGACSGKHACGDAASSEFPSQFTYGWCAIYFPSSHSSAVQLFSRRCWLPGYVSDMYPYYCLRQGWPPSLKSFQHREIYRLSSPDVPNERSRFAAAAAADLSPSSTTTQYYLIHPPRLGLFNPIQILGLKLSWWSV